MQSVIPIPSAAALEPVRSLWIGPRLPAAQRLCIASFLRVGHPYELYAYGPVEGLPVGARLRDANEILPQDRVFAYGPNAGRGAGSFAGFSNVFRYALLLAKGGYWVDTDVLCLRPFPTDPIVIASERRSDGRITTATCVLRCPADHAFMEYCFYRASLSDPASLVWGQIGPALVAQAVIDLNLDACVASPDQFCSIDWFEHERLCQPGEPSEHALGLHLWGERWRQMGQAIPWPAPLGSLLSEVGQGLGVVPGVSPERDRPSSVPGRDIDLPNRHSASPDWSEASTGAHSASIPSRLSAREYDSAS